MKQRGGLQDAITYTQQLARSRHGDDRKGQQSESDFLDEYHVFVCHWREPMRFGLKNCEHWMWFGFAC
jgi:hypothetical protein